MRYQRQIFGFCIYNAGDSALSQIQGKRQKSMGVREPEHHSGSAARQREDRAPDRRMSPSKDRSSKATEGRVSSNSRSWRTYYEKGKERIPIPEKMVILIHCFRMGEKKIG